VRFRATIELGGKTATGVQVPEKVVTGLGGGGRPKVRATINGYTYRSSVASMGGRYMLGLSAEVRERAGVAAGDTVDVDLELDTEVREVTVPPDLSKAFRRDAAARRAFERLSYSRQQRYVLSIEGAKTEETRQRRIDTAIADLRAGA
jgi:hypothetical protein